MGPKEGRTGLNRVCFFFYRTTTDKLEFRDWSEVQQMFRSGEVQQTFSGEQTLFLLLILILVEYQAALQRVCCSQVDIQFAGMEYNQNIYYLGQDQGLHFHNLCKVGLVAVSMQAFHYYQLQEGDMLMRLEQVEIMDLIDDIVVRIHLPRQN